MRFVAIDWSGRKIRPEEKIWVAEVEEGSVVSLRNGRNRDEIRDYLGSYLETAKEVVVGLDFAFSFPEWWCQEQGFQSMRDVWSFVAENGEQILEDPGPPFFGRAGTRAPLHAAQWRTADKDVKPRPKSPFQIGGSGHVGTGSIRGMPMLLELSDQGFSIWPIQEPGRATLVEIYPRVFAPGVTKTRYRDRAAHLERHFPELQGPLFDLAACSDDAFDAAISAISMSRNWPQLPPLEAVPYSPYLLEGKIWAPDLEN